jgi:hypothetical protein
MLDSRIAGGLSANRKLSGIDDGISPVKSASRQEIKRSRDARLSRLIGFWIFGDTRNWLVLESLSTKERPANKLSRTAGNSPR